MYKNFQHWADTIAQSEGFKNIILESDILILPTEDIRDGSGLTFERTTESLFNYLKANLPTEYSVEIGIDELDYRILSFNSNYKRLGKFLVKDVAVPIFLGIILLYIEKNLFEDDKPVNNNITIVDSSKNEKNADKDTIENKPLTTEHSKKLVHPHKKFLDPPKSKLSIVIDYPDGTLKEFNFDGETKDLKLFLDTINKEYKKNGDSTRVNKDEDSTRINKDGDSTRIE